MMDFQSFAFSDSNKTQISGRLKSSEGYFTEIFRPTDLAVGKGNPSKAKIQLGWEARYKMQDVVKMMVDARLES